MREYNDPGQQLGRSLLYKRVLPSYSQDSSTVTEPRSFGSGPVDSGDALQSTVSLQIILRTRQQYTRLPPTAREECVKDVSRNFRLETARDTFDSTPHAQVAGLHRDHLLGVCRQVEALRGGPPEREDLVLLWMMKHYDKEAAVPWKSAYTAAQKFTRPGERIEYVTVQALSKMYANPLAASMARDALDNFQWLPKTNVQVVQAAFAVLLNTYERAVEDT
jgi:hypothetical protein